MQTTISSLEARDHALSAELAQANIVIARLKAAEASLTTQLTASTTDSRVWGRQAAYAEARYLRIEGQLKIARASVRKAHASKAEADEKLTVVLRHDIVSPRAQRLSNRGPERSPEPSPARSSEHCRDFADGRCSRTTCIFAHVQGGDDPPAYPARGRDSGGQFCPTDPNRISSPSDPNRVCIIKKRSRGN